jgi:hypothetical protein
VQWSASSRDGAADGGELGSDLAAESRDSGNQRSADECDQEGVLNHRCAFFTREQTLDKSSHFLPPLIMVFRGNQCHARYASYCPATGCRRRTEAREGSAYRVPRAAMTASEGSGGAVLGGVFQP